MSSNIFNCCADYHKNPLEEFKTMMEENNFLELNAETYINGRMCETFLILEELDDFMRLLRRNWCYLQSSIANNVSVLHNELITLREEITTSLKLITLNISNNPDNEEYTAKFLTPILNHMKTFSLLILPVAELDETVFSKLTSSSRNKDKCPIYLYFHTFLDIQYYLLFLANTAGGADEFKNHLTLIITDLVNLSEKHFKQQKNITFICDCVKNMWLVIQFMSEKILGEENFWPIFNNVLEGKDCRFVLQMLKDIGELQAFGLSGKFLGNLSSRIKPNFGLLESSIKNIVSNREFNTSILTPLKAIEPLLCVVWLKSAKIEVYQTLWEYFSKRLNLSTRSNFNCTMNELVEIINTISKNPKDCDEDFELFLSMLALHLNEHPYHWGKMKGRIYSQLGPNKVKDLNNTGIYHVLLLFVVLTKVTFEELSKKFLGFIEALPNEKKNSQLVWNFYSSFILCHVRESRSIETVSAPLTKMLQDASRDQNHFHLLKQFITNFDTIMKCSVNCQLHQWILINTWVPSYMTSCYHQDLLTFLNVLLASIDKINSEEVWCEWESSFKNYVFPTLTTVSTSRTAPEICGNLAGKIALQCPTLLNEAFVFFNGESVSPKVTSNFLCVVLDAYPNSVNVTPQQEIMALQSWIKIGVLTRDNYEQLTRNLIKLEIIPEFIKADLATARDPICTFIETLSKNISQHIQSLAMTKFCENCFQSAEKWITQYLVQPDNEATVLRIYTCMALAFYKIGALLYNRHKSSCLYTNLVATILLPTELVLGKVMHPHVLQAIKKTWHLFFEATIKLNTPNDAYIDRTLRELVVRYIPHFAVVDSPILKCLDNSLPAGVILDKMAGAFFKYPTKEAESSVLKALRIVNEFVQGTTSRILLKLVVTKTLHGLFEVVMFHSQRNMALSIVKNIIGSQLFVEVQAEFEQVIVSLTEKHIAFNSQNYFQLMNILAKFMPSVLRKLTPGIKQQIANVERLRGVGFDQSLRLSIERLEAALLQM